MKRFFPLLSVLFITLSIISCSKEISIETTGNGSGSGSGNGTGSGTGTNSTDIIGDWIFVKMYAKTKSTVEYSDGGDSYKTITNSEYTTTDNTGTVKITDSKLTSTGVGYSMSTTASADMYLNNTFLTSASLPVSYIAPPGNSDAPYKKINADSIYFTSGGFIDMGSGAVASNPVGARVKLDQDVLTLTMPISQTITQTVSGITQKIKAEGTVVTTLKRQ
ncbi:MAG: hypothetical protein QM731_15405 [Chitinophagaceae bacterium]